MEKLWRVKIFDTNFSSRPHILCNREINRFWRIWFVEHGTVLGSTCLGYNLQKYMYNYVS